MSLLFELCHEASHELYSELLLFDIVRNKCVSHICNSPQFDLLDFLVEIIFVSACLTSLCFPLFVSAWSRALALGRQNFFFFLCCSSHSTSRRAYTNSVGFALVAHHLHTKGAQLE